MKGQLKPVPTKQNTIMCDEQVPKLEPVFARPKQLASIYSLSISTVHRYIEEIEADEAFNGIVIRPAPSVVIIHIKDFRYFLGERQKRAFSRLEYQ